MKRSLFRVMLPLALLGGNSRAYLLLALTGLNSSLEQKLQEMRADVNAVLCWSGASSLLDRLLDSQLPDHCLLRPPIDMRPLCRLFALGLDPTLITPPHSTSPLQRA